MDFYGTVEVNKNDTLSYQIDVKKDIKQEDWFYLCFTVI